MLIHLPQLISSSDAAEFCARLEGTGFEDGRATARGRAREIKRNLQLAPETPLARELGAKLQARLARSEAFSSAALPERVLTPRFCKYEEGMFYGEHLDLPLMQTPAGAKLRTDLSMTLFLSESSSYEGGELRFSGELGERVLRGAAGDAVVYPASLKHEVLPVTSGQRIVAITWIQSLVRDAGQRKILFDLLHNLQQLEVKHGQSAETLELRQCHYNLMRRWCGT